jgi:hypothetical protein
MCGEYLYAALGGNRRIQRTMFVTETAIRHLSRGAHQGPGKEFTAMVQGGLSMSRLWR